jgi:hypothetical protein
MLIETAVVVLIILVPTYASHSELSTMKVKSDFVTLKMNYVPDIRISR